MALIKCNRSVLEEEQRGMCDQGWPYVVHHLLKSLAERTPTNSRCTFPVWEGKLADVGDHPILLHHGVGYLGHLLQVILCSWAGETDTMLASSEMSAPAAHPAQTDVTLVKTPVQTTCSG